MQMHSYLITTKRHSPEKSAVIYPFDRFFRVVCVGGDGMFSEMFHGLLTRAHRDNGIDHPAPGASLKMPSLRIGIIPSGL